MTESDVGSNQCDCSVMPQSSSTKKLSVFTSENVASPVVCIDLLGKEQHKQVCVDRVATSRSLGGLMASTPAWNARDVGSIPALGAIFPILITRTTVACKTP